MAITNFSGFPEPGIGDSARIEKSNQEYHNNPEMMPLEDAKAKLRNSLYGNNEINPVEDSINQLRNSLDLKSEKNSENGDIIIAVDPTEQLSSLSGTEELDKEEEMVKVEGEEVGIEEVLVEEKPVGVEESNKEPGKKIEESIDKIELGALEDSPLAPILEGLLKQDHIDVETYNETVKKIQSSSPEGIVPILDDVLSNIPTIDVKERANIIKKIKGVETVTEDNFEQTDFFADFQNPESGSKPEGNDLDLLLAENYIKITGIEGNNEGKKNNLNISFNVVLNKIINKQSIDFKQQNSDIINEIRQGENVLGKYVLLQKLLKESKIEDSRGGSNQAREYKNKKNIDSEKAEILKEKFNNLKEQVKNAKNIKNEKIKNLEIKKEIESLIIENNEAEVIPAGDLDILLKEIQEVISEQA